MDCAPRFKPTYGARVNIKKEARVAAGPLRWTEIRFRDRASLGEKRLDDRYARRAVLALHERRVGAGRQRDENRRLGVHQRGETGRLNRRQRRALSSRRSTSAASIRNKSAASYRPARRSRRIAQATGPARAPALAPVW